MAPSNRLSAFASRRSLCTAPPPSFICLQCRLQASATTRTRFPSSNPLVPSRQYASLTDRVRKKIWGSETPPGQEDPYGGASVLDQRKREQELEDKREGRSVQVAPTSEELKEVGDENETSDYVAKVRWDGLDRVGYEGWGREKWDKQHPFEGYMNPRTESQYEIIAGIHRALVEVYTLKQEGLPLVMDYFAYDLNNEYALRLAEGAKFESDGQGGTRVAVEDEELRQDILESVKLNEDTMEEIIQQEELQAEEYTEEEEPSSREADSMPLQESASPTIEDDDLENEISEDEEFSDDTSESVHDHTFGGKYPIKPADDSWRDIAFENLQIKFAVLKRVMQLTGMRIPDPDIACITNTKALLGHLVRKPKPKKLAESLFANEVAELPNVQIIERRFTPIDKEKEIGRWKVIEKELQARGLPVTGNDAGTKAATAA